MPKLLNKTSPSAEKEKKPYRLARILVVSAFLLCIAVSALLFLLHFGKRETYTYSPKTKILLYHLVRDDTYGPYEYLFVKEADFEAQLQEIQKMGYRTVFADELSELDDERAVVITFDDGYVDNYTTAFPLLQKYGMKATVFLSSGIIGEEGHLTEAQIKEMQESGVFRFGSHTVNHVSLDTALSDVIEYELSASKDAIEAIIGEEVSAFAYPNGAYNDMVELFAEKHGYRFCYTTNPPTEPYYENTALPRSYVVRDMPMADFLALLTDESENDKGEH